jgi:hypothetical protein
MNVNPYVAMGGVGVLAAGMGMAMGIAFNANPGHSADDPDPASIRHDGLTASELIPIGIGTGIAGLAGGLFGGLGGGMFGAVAGAILGGTLVGGVVLGNQLSN